MQAVESWLLPTRPSALVFDLDGTLIDSVPGIAASLRVAFQVAGRVMPDRDLRALIGPPIKVIARRLEPCLSDEDLARIEPAYRASYDSEGWAVCELFPGVLDTLRALHHQGLPIFIVTNKPQLPTVRILERLAITPLIVAAVSRDSRVPNYPDKTSMLAALVGRHGLDPSGTWMVGDTEEDGEAAAENGMPFVHVTYGYGSSQAAQKAINNFSDLRELLLPESAAQLL